MKLPTTLRTLMHSVGCLRGGKISPLIVPSGTGTSENPFRPLRTVPERLEYRQIRTGTEVKRAVPALRCRALNGKMSPYVPFAHVCEAVAAERASPYANKLWLQKPKSSNKCCENERRTSI